MIGSLLRSAIAFVMVSAATAAATAEHAPLGSIEPWTPSAGDVIAFDVLRQGNEFGSHVVRFEQVANGTTEVVVDVDLKAGFGPITLFRYQLDARETWQDGNLVALQGEVNDDGSRETVSARRDGDLLDVAGDGFDGAVNLGILPASHWNVAQTKADTLLSTENGELIEVVVEYLGRETIEAGGQTVEANKFLMDSDIDVALWYGDDGRWLKLAFEARGQAIEYVLRELY